MKTFVPILQFVLISFLVEEDYYCSRGIGSSWHNGIMWLNKERTVTRT